MEAELYPPGFEPNEPPKLVMLPNGSETKVQIRRTLFKRGKEIPWEFSWGGKPSVDYHNEGLFPELAIRNTILEKGWHAEWVEGDGYIQKWQPAPRNHQIVKPIQRLRDRIELLRKIDEQAAGIFAKHDIGSFYGCWDILAWKGNRTLFIESKQRNENLTDPQKRWLEAALSINSLPQNEQFDFLIVKWEYQKESPTAQIRL